MLFRSWQSGVLWADGARKESFAPLASVVADANNGKISCAAPTAPSALAAELSGDPPQVKLSWGAGASEIGVSGYQVVRDGVSIGRTTGLTYTDATAALGATYSYSVRGDDAAGGSGDPSAAVIVSVPAPPAPPQPPPPPPPPAPPPLLPPAPAAPLAPPAAPQSQPYAAACVVPNVIGKRVAIATRAIARRHCRVGGIGRVWSLRIARGRIISESPKPGRRLGNQARVNLLVSRGRRR